MSEFEGIDPAELAADLTGTAGVPDDVAICDAVPQHIASAVEEFDQHQAERDLQVQDGAEDDPQGPRRVPLGALQEERRRRQELQDQNRHLQEQAALIQRQFAEWQQRLAHEQQLAQQAAAEAAMPTFEEDPAGYIRAREAQIAQQIAAIQQDQQQRARSEHVQRQVAANAQAMATEIAPLEQAFEAEHPDYREAFSYIEQQADELLTQNAPQATQAERQFLKTVVFADFLAQAKARGLHPCAEIMARAQARGWKPGQQGWRAPGSAPQQPVHQQQRPSAPANVTLDQIAKMSEADFDAYWQQLAQAGKPRFAF